MVPTYSSILGILTFPNREALIISALKGMKKGTGPIRAVVPNALTGVSNYCPTSATDGLLRGGWSLQDCAANVQSREDYGHAFLVQSNCTCAPKLKGSRKCTSSRTLLLEAWRFDLVPRARLSTGSTLCTIYMPLRSSQAYFGLPVWAARRLPPLSDYGSFRGTVCSSRVGGSLLLRHFDPATRHRRLYRTVRIPQ